ncbi:hypothetical protein NUSPORA_01511 [Nucleospora cyclopteri]
MSFDFKHAFVSVVSYFNTIFSSLSFKCCNVSFALENKLEIDRYDKIIYDILKILVLCMWTFGTAIPQLSLILNAALALVSLVKSIENSSQRQKSESYKYYYGFSNEIIKQFEFPTNCFFKEIDQCKEYANKLKNIEAYKQLETKFPTDSNDVFEKIELIIKDEIKFFTANFVVAIVIVIAFSLITGYYPIFSVCIFMAIGLRVIFEIWYIPNGKIYSLMILIGMIFGVIILGIFPFFVFLLSVSYNAIIYTFNLFILLNKNTVIDQHFINYVGKSSVGKGELEKYLEKNDLEEKFEYCLKTLGFMICISCLTNLCVILSIKLIQKYVKNK